MENWNSKGVVFVKSRSHSTYCFHVTGLAWLELEWMMHRLFFLAWNAVPARIMLATMSTGIRSPRLKSVPMSYLTMPLATRKVNAPAAAIESVHPG